MGLTSSYFSSTTAIHSCERDIYTWNWANNLEQVTIIRYQYDFEQYFLTLPQGGEDDPYRQPIINIGPLSDEQKPEEVLLFWVDRM